MTITETPDHSTTQDMTHHDPSTESTDLIATTTRSNHTEDCRG